ncbi:hypothetical protein DFH07DRAFT_301436 [Mycena maculata]|uniref:Ankyrin n=1 Tax=Mycena maculata TaxID=230809 RepID=A0AAD7JR79_9AGAR|nr:hypothetical protein DFH07DRAFT_301436 [Mycena maculata]
MGSKYGSPLQAVSVRGHEGIVRLLEKGADVNAAAGVYGSALQAASAEGNKDIAQLLLEHGAEASVVESVEAKEDTKPNEAAKEERPIDAAGPGEVDNPTRTAEVQDRTFSVKDIDGRVISDLSVKVYSSWERQGSTPSTAYPQGRICTSAGSTSNSN